VPLCFARWKEVESRSETELLSGLSKQMASLKLLSRPGLPTYITTQRLIEPRNMVCGWCPSGTRPHDVAHSLYLRPRFHGRGGVLSITWPTIVCSGEQLALFHPTKAKVRRNMSSVVVTLLCVAFPVNVSGRVAQANVTSDRSDSRFEAVAMCH
jgi:hypothetical protein